MAANDAELKEQPQGRAEALMLSIVFDGFIFRFWLNEVPSFGSSTMYT